MVMSTGIIEQAVTEISLMQLAARGLPKRRRRKYRNHEKRHTSINKEEYEAGDYILSKRLKANSHWVEYSKFSITNCIYHKNHIQI